MPRSGFRILSFQFKTINWAEKYGVYSIETEYGETLYPAPAPAECQYRPELPASPRTQAQGAQRHDPVHDCQAGWEIDRVAVDGEGPPRTQQQRPYYLGKRHNAHRYFHSGSQRVVFLETHAFPNRQQ